MSTLNKCDRCRELVSDTQIKNAWFVMKIMNGNDSWDLCGKCMEYFKAFMNPARPYIPTAEEAIDMIEEANNLDYRESSATTEEKVNTKISEIRNMLNS